MHASGQNRGLRAVGDDPTEEELARDWTLSEADRAEVFACRGDDNRRRFVIQLCSLRSRGVFIEDYASVPRRILGHLSHQPMCGVF